MFPFGAGAEEQGLWRDECEGGWVGDYCYAEGLEEGFVEGIEDGVLGVDGD